jgi:hypothetical protein
MSHDPAYFREWRKRNRPKWNEYNRQWMARKRASDRHLRAVQGVEKPKPPVAFITCYWCNTPFRSDLNACPECGTAKDEERSNKAAKRAQKGYLDIVRENAERAGKDPNLEIKKAKWLGFNSVEVNVALDAYRESKGGVIQKTGWSAVQRKLKPKICEMCGNEFMPRIISNRYGGQRVCTTCRPERDRRRKRARWARHHEKKEAPTP